MTVRLIVILAFGAAGCGLWQPGWTSDPASSLAAETLLDHARGEVEAGRPKNAIVLYENVIRDNAGTPPAAMALHELAVLRLEARAPIRDRRAAQQLLARLAKEYPNTRWGREAKAWRILFRQVDRCEAEATRLGADAEDLRQTIESLKDADVDLEELP